MPRLGEKTYEQAIGFLRIIGGNNPLDASAVHPESYALIDQIIEVTHQPIQVVDGKSRIIKGFAARAVC